MTTMNFAYWTDGTDTGIQMRATDKGRVGSLIAMVQGDRRDAIDFERFRGFARDIVRGETIRATENDQ